MDIKTRKIKVRALKNFLGLMVIAYFKQCAIVEEQSDGSVMSGKGLAGFLVDVDEAFAYFGATDEIFDTLVCLEDLGIVRVMDDVDQVLKLTGNEPGVMGDIQ